MDGQNPSGRRRIQGKDLAPKSRIRKSSRCSPQISRGGQTQYDASTKPTIERVLQRIHPDDRAMTRRVLDETSRGEIGACPKKARALSLSFSRPQRLPAVQSDERKNITQISQSRNKLQAYFIRVDSTPVTVARFGRISEDPRTGLNGSIAQTAIYGGAAQRLPFIKTECERP